jgi:hypothetical protein
VRLAELNPRWVAEADAPEGHKQGVSFVCPHCMDPNNRLAVFFNPPVVGNPPDITQIHRDQADSGHLADHHVGRIVWTRVSGETFDDLTLTPSIDASAWGCWHGHITNGEVA